MNVRRGFTLIELLVVIAIIGILSAVVLAALSTARTRGNDAAIKADMETIRSQAAVYYDAHGSSYNSTGAAINGNTAGDCGIATGAGSNQPANTMLSDPNISAALLNIHANNGGAKIYCNLDKGQSYSIATPLSTANAAWCTDTTNASQGQVGNPASPSYGQSYDKAFSTIDTAAALSSGVDYSCN